MAKDDYTDLINSYDISESAKIIYLKELNKETAKIFSLAWLAEYWRGERTAVWAFLTWIVFIPLLAILGFILFIFIFGSLPTHNPKWDVLIDPLILIAELTVCAYIIFANVIWFRCSKNSTSLTQKFIRIVSMLFMGYWAILFIGFLITWFH